MKKNLFRRIKNSAPTDIIQRVFFLFHMTDSFWGNWVRFNWNDTEFFFIAKRERFPWGIFFNCNGGHFF